MKIAIYHGHEFGNGLSGEIMDILDEFSLSEKVSEIHYNTDCEVPVDDLSLVPIESDTKIIRDDLYTIPECDQYLVLTAQFHSDWTQRWIISLHSYNKRLIIIENGKKVNQ